MAWVIFSDRTAFFTYHDAVATAQSLPRPGARQSDAVTNLDAQWTTAWVLPVADSGTIKANVPTADVATYNLTPTTAPLVTYAADGMTITSAPTDATFVADVPRLPPATYNGAPVPVQMIGIL